MKLASAAARYVEAKAGARRHRGNSYLKNPNSNPSPPPITHTQLMKKMTANSFDDASFDPVSLWGYTRHKFSKRALLTFDSLRLLEKVRGGEE